MRDDGKHAQLVAVVEHFSKLVGETQVGAVIGAACEADRPVVLALLEDVLRAALLKRFRNGLATHLADADTQAKSKSERPGYKETPHVSHPHSQPIIKIFKSIGPARI